MKLTFSPCLRGGYNRKIIFGRKFVLVGRGTHIWRGACIRGGVIFRVLRYIPHNNEHFPPNFHQTFAFHFQCMEVGPNGQNGVCVTNRATLAHRHACALARTQLLSSEEINVKGNECNIWNATNTHVEVSCGVFIFLQGL